MNPQSQVQDPFSQSNKEPLKVNIMGGFNFAEYAYRGLNLFYVNY